MLFRRSLLSLYDVGAECFSMAFPFCSQFLLPGLRAQTLSPTLRDLSFLLFTVNVFLV